MAITIKSNDTGLPASAWRTGAPLQSAWGYNIASASRVFRQYSRWEEVPGKLECTLTPSSVNNIIVITAHIAWGGWARTSTAVTSISGTDVAANFRIFKDNGSGPQPFGFYSSEPTLDSNVPGYAVATGVYKYNQGDNNSSFDSDDILIHHNVTSSEVGKATKYAVYWACGYAPDIRTFYWNRSISLGNSYNPYHTCTISAVEYKV